VTPAHERRPIVLFVDDTKLLSDEFPIQLRREGYTVLTAVNVPEAMAHLETATHVDLAILDIQLPLEGCQTLGIAETEGGKLAGLILAHELRRKFKRTPILFGPPPILETCGDGSKL
jgi:CheY-like chemotaxis protein